MQNLKYYIISLLMFIFGLLFYCLYNDLIIIKFYKQKQNTSNQLTAQKKIYKLIFWNNNRWQIDQKEIIDTDNKIKNLNHLVTSWLNWLEEEQIMHKKISVQSIMLNNASTEAYISFDRNPLNKEQSTFTKLMWLESLLKTLRENNTNLQAIYLLVHYKPLIDSHLDFSHPWPITGFLKD